MGNSHSFAQDHTLLAAVAASGAIIALTIFFYASGAGRSTLAWVLPLSYSLCVVMGALVGFLGLTVRGRYEYRERAGLAYAAITGALVATVILWPFILRPEGSSLLLDDAVARGAYTWVNHFRLGFVGLLLVVPFSTIEPVAESASGMMTHTGRVRIPVFAALVGVVGALLVGSVAERYAPLSAGRGAEAAQLVVGGLIALLLFGEGAMILRRLGSAEDSFTPYMGVAALLFGLVEVAYIVRASTGNPGLFVRAFFELAPFGVALVGLVRAWGASSREQDGGALDIEELRKVQLVHEAAIGQERRRASQLQVLNQLAVIINSESNPGRMLDEVLRGATHLTGARGGSLYLVSNGVIRLEAFSASPETSGRSGSRPPGLEAKALALQAVAERRLIRLAQELQGETVRYYGYMAVPLVTADAEALGCFVLVGAPAGVGFTAEDEMVASTLAAHVTVALQNQRRLKKEQQVAEHLQRAMLPRVVKVPGLEVDTTYESAADATLVGGDFYDIIPLGHDRTCLVVGDVCGKGLGAATQMAMIRHMLRAYAPLEFRAGRWLEMANDAVEENLSTADFITTALVVADTATRILDYSLAGHPPPVMALPGEVTELSGRPGLPVGARRSQKYETHRVFLPRGATLIMYTDGLYEARNGQEMFGEKALSEAAKQTAAAESLRGSAARLVQAAREFAGGRLVDDVVVLTFRVSED